MPSGFTIGVIILLTVALLIFFARILILHKKNEKLTMRLLQQRESAASAALNGVINAIAVWTMHPGKYAHSEEESLLRKIQIFSYAAQNIESFEEKVAKIGFFQKIFVSNEKHQKYMSKYEGIIESVKRLSALMRNEAWEARDFVYECHIAVGFIHEYKIDALETQLNNQRN